MTYEGYRLVGYFYGYFIIITKKSGLIMAETIKEGIEFGINSFLKTAC